MLVKKIQFNVNINKNGLRHISVNIEGGNNNKGDRSNEF